MEYGRASIERAARLTVTATRFALNERGCKMAVGLNAMQIVTLRAHFDGKQILLDEPYELEPATKLLVSLIPKQDEEREDWARFAWANLERAYADDEPAYSLWRCQKFDETPHQQCE